jgi:hypothetical protein
VDDSIEVQRTYAPSIAEGAQISFDRCDPVEHQRRGVMQCENIVIARSAHTKVSTHKTRATRNQQFHCDMVPHDDMVRPRKMLRFQA